MILIYFNQILISFYPFHSLEKFNREERKEKEKEKKLVSEIKRTRLGGEQSSQRFMESRLFEKYRTRTRIWNIGQINHNFQTWRFRSKCEEIKRRKKRESENTRANLNYFIAYTINGRNDVSQCNSSEKKPEKFLNRFPNFFPFPLNFLSIRKIYYSNYSIREIFRHLKEKEKEWSKLTASLFIIM